MANRGQRIRQARLMHRMSQKDLAADVGVSLRTLQSIEAGAHPTGRNIERVEAHLGLDEGTGGRSSSAPTLDTASDADLLYELYRRLTRADGRPILDRIPDVAIPGLILGPPDLRQTRHEGETGA